jgi:hypothetical protein
MTKKKTKYKKPYTRMTAAELAEATEQYDRAELPDKAGRAMTPRERAEWSSDKRPRGRPRKGRGAVNVLISFERGLLERADSFAQDQGIGRSALVAQALESLMREKEVQRRPRVAV